MTIYSNAEYADNETPRLEISWVGPPSWGLFAASYKSVFFQAFQSSAERARIAGKPGGLHVETDSTFALAEAAAAHAYLEGRNAFGRVVVVP